MVERVEANVRRLLWGALVVFVAIVIGSTAAGAQESSDDPFWDNDTCLSCHQQSGLLVELPSKESLRLDVYRAEYDQSVHGEYGVACRNCHLDIGGFPHPELSATTRAEYRATQSDACLMCHRDHYTKVADELHVEIGGLLCTDCHDPHTTGTSNSVTSEVRPACVGCHPGGVSIPAEGIHAGSEVPERAPNPSGWVILGFIGAGIVGIVVLIWLGIVGWRAIRAED